MVAGEDKAPLHEVPVSIIPTGEMVAGEDWQTYTAKRGANYTNWGNGCRRRPLHAPNVRQHYYTNWGNGCRRRLQKAGVDALTDYTNWGNGCRRRLSVLEVGGDHDYTNWGNGCRRRHSVLSDAL